VVLRRWDAGVDYRGLPAILGVLGTANPQCLKGQCLKTGISAGSLHRLHDQPPARCCRALDDVLPQRPRRASASQTRRLP
jgi:hypothetical protein